MSHLAETVEYASCSLMYKSLRVLQLNVGKRDMVQQSLMNDNKIRDYGVVAVSEPYARIIENTVVVSFICTFSAGLSLFTGKGLVPYLLTVVTLSQSCSWFKDPSICR